jgi:hypothetical protein
VILFRDIGDLIYFRQDWAFLGKSI